MHARMHYAHAHIHASICGVGELGGHGMMMWGGTYRAVLPPCLSNRRVDVEPRW